MQDLHEVATPNGNALNAAHDEAPAAEQELPRELLREVASNLKALSRVVSYEEYASIVQRIAQVRWRCERRESAGLANSDVTT